MLSNFDLYDLADEYSLTLDDICHKNNITNNKKKTNMNIIINLQDSNKGNGTHWVCLVKKDNNYVYFDSFGAQPPKVIQQYCKRNLGYNNYIVQNLNTETCGYYCIAFIHYIRSHKGGIYELANEFINLFEDNTTRNNNILRDYLNTI